MKKKSEKKAKFKMQPFCHSFSVFMQMFSVTPLCIKSITTLLKKNMEARFLFLIQAFSKQNVE